MRKTWLAVATIVSLVVIAASYRIARPGKPQPEARSSEQPEARAVEPQPPEAAPLVRPSRGDHEAAPPPSSGIEAPDEHTVPRGRTAAPVPAAVDRPPSPPASYPGATLGATATPKASSATPPVAAPRPAAAPGPTPETVKPTAPPTAPQPSSTGAPTQEPTKEGDAAAPADDPESDRRPPVLQFLRFDPPEIKDGGTTALSIGASDELSGIKAVYGAVRSPSGAAMVPFSARDIGGVFGATIAIPPRGETGDWFIANLQIVDRAENNLTLVFARATVPEGGALRVVSDDSDSQAPDVHRVSVVRASVDAGERNQIVVDVEDDRSGVALVSGAFQSPSKSAFIPFNCVHNGDSPSWEGDIAVPENADCGEWTLRQLRVVDKANNSAFLSMDSPQVGRVSFSVSGAGACDAEPPVVDAMYFTPTVVSNETASEVVVTIQAHDDGSGVATVSGWIDGPVATNGQAPRIYFECMADRQDPRAPMTARVTVPQFAAKGTWRVTLAQVADKARNVRSYNRNDPALSEATFTVE